MLFWSRAYCLLYNGKGLVFPFHVNMQLCHLSLEWCVGYLEKSDVLCSEWCSIWELNSNFCIMFQKWLWHRDTGWVHSCHLVFAALWKLNSKVCSSTGLKDPFYSLNITTVMWCVHGSIWAGDHFGIDMYHTLMHLYWEKAH